MKQRQSRLASFDSQNLPKKAQGLPVNTIIIAILAIAVLFIILFVFLRKGGEFTQATSDCVAQGGQCVPSCSEDSVRVIGGRCADSVCCRALLKKTKGELCNTNDECASGDCAAEGYCT